MVEGTTYLMAATNVIKCEDWMETQQSKSMALKKTKAP
jgi:hypothetical protein